MVGSDEGSRSHCPAPRSAPTVSWTIGATNSVGTLERQTRRGQGPTERQRIAAVALLKKFDPALTARAVSNHLSKLTPEAVERVHRDARGREKDST